MAYCMCRINEDYKNKGSGCTSFAISFCFDIVDSVYVAISSLAIFKLLSK